MYRKILSCRIAMILLAIFFFSPTVGAQKLPVAEEKLLGQLRKLEKDITAVRGLEFKEPVRAKIVSRPAKAGKGIQGYYSPAEKTLFLYDDISGAYQMGVLIHEMVHALQDQHFDLVKLRATLHQDKFGSDAEMALAALIEGDATYTMIEVLKKDQPKAAAMLEVPLEKAKNLQNAFLYAQGARYVKNLKDKGDWKTVNFAYKFPPRTTASILNLTIVIGRDLGPGKSHGAFGLIKMLAENEHTRPQAVALAKAWRGDRLLETKAGRAWILACANQEQALKMKEALVLFKTSQGFNSEEKKPAEGKDWVSVLVRGSQVWVLEAADAKSFPTLLDRLEGPPSIEIVSRSDKKTISFGDMVGNLLDADMICVGEKHDSVLHHRLQAQIIKALFAQDERLGVGMEMFQKPFQKSLDQYVQGELKEEDFLQKSEYLKRWGYDWALYRPIVDFCRRNGVPLAALNAPRELTSRISKVGHAGLNDEEKKQLGPIDFQLKEHRDHWYERLAKLHGQDKATPEQKEKSYQVMAVWDDFMARSAVEFQKSRNLRRLVVLAGSGHIERGFGIPLRAQKIGNLKVATVAFAPDEEKSELLADFVIRVR